MINTGGRVTFWLRIGSWMCACLPKRSMDDDMRARIRPLTFAGLACWCDRSSARRSD